MRRGAGRSSFALSGSCALISQLTALWQQGRLDEAEARARTALALAPRSDAILEQLGIIVSRKGNEEQAIGFFRQAIALNARIASYHGNLGNAYLQAGRPADATTAFRETLALSPGLAVAQFGLGLASIRQRDYETAAHQLAMAAKARPNHADTHLNLGHALTELGRIGDAISHCRRARDLNPEFAPCHYRLGNALSAKGEWAAARNCLIKALELLDTPVVKPSFGTSKARLGEQWSELGSSFFDLRQFDEAIFCYQKGLLLAPTSVALHRAIGRARFRQSRPQEARTAFLAALDIDPDDTEAIVSVGRTYQAEGQFDQAVTWLQKALARQPDHPEAHFNLGVMDSISNRDKRIQQLEVKLADPALDGDRRGSANFALGKLYDEAGDYRRAFDCFSKANELRRPKHYRPADQSAAVSRLIKGFPAALVQAKQGHGSKSERPVFIVGMPRSGTTLVEQILSSHPQVHGHGELEIISNLVVGLPTQLGNQQPYPECLDNLGAGTTLELAAHYLLELERDGSLATRNIDKMPDNYMHLGLIALLFPHAKVIHCQRDPLDTCLSCYFQDFGKRQPFSCDLEHLGRYYRDYQRLMAHWHATLPAPIFDISYEALIADQEAWSRKLVDFIGLPWDQECLSFHKTERPVFTARLWQVRQPIYSSSVGRWRHYERYLGSLKDVLSAG